jgi:beta-glucosidase
MKKLLSCLLLLCFLSNFLFSQHFEKQLDSIIALMNREDKIMQLHQYGVFNTLDNEKLNIPGLFMSDGPHGIKQGRSTCFPVGIAMAASWDTSLVKRIGRIMGKEFRGKGIHQALGPCMDLCRDPRNGRSPETGGEDPFLCGKIASSLVKGIQEYPVIATSKHFNCVAMQDNRFHNDVSISEKMHMDHYGFNFRTAVQEGATLSVMNAFNLINGVNCAENKFLLDTILRQRWGFPFQVVSDWGAVWDTKGAMEAGVDICMGSYLYRDELPGLLNSEALSEEVLDQRVKGVLRSKMLAGFTGYYPTGNRSMVNLPEHQRVCREAGRKSIVLLKNEDDILPIEPSAINKIALVGPAADQALLDGKGSSSVIPYYSITPKEGMEALLGADRVLYEKGCEINSNSTGGFSEAKEIARQADHVIFVGGLGPSQEGEGRDRINGSVRLPGKQPELINELAAVNSNLTVVIISGGICAANEYLENARGLLYAFYPGQEGGNAIADVIFGKYNPSAKLPVTMPKSDAQLPENNLDYNDDYGGGYRWFDKKDLTPEFPFGYGLSYTTFGYSNISATSNEIRPGQPVEISVDVENTGAITGEEVIQLYIYPENPSRDEPEKQLKAFRIIELEPGEKKSVSFELTANEFYSYDPILSQYQVAPGLYTIKIGSNSEDLHQQAEIKITEGVFKPDLRISKVFSYPRYPVKGEPVTFVALVLNYGTGPSPNQIHSLDFITDNDIQIPSTNYVKSIPAGGMAFISADMDFYSGASGKYTFTATIDPDNEIDECIEYNNSATGSFVMHDSTVINKDTFSNNIALNKPAKASEYQDENTLGAFAVDGKKTTRWGVEDRWSDIQTLEIDLLNQFFIDSVNLLWCPVAYPERLSFQFRDTTGKWYTAKIIDEAFGGFTSYQKFPDKSTRHIRLRTLKRHTGWIPYSLFEMEVFGMPDTTNNSDANDSIVSVNDCRKMEPVISGDVFPNPFKNSFIATYSVNKRTDVRIELFDVSGKRIKILKNGIHNPGNYYLTWNSTRQNDLHVNSGLYLLRFSTDSIRVNKLLIKQN